MKTTHGSSLRLADLQPSSRRVVVSTFTTVNICFPNPQQKAAAAQSLIHKSVMLQVVPLWLTDDFDISHFWSSLLNLALFVIKNIRSKLLIYRYHHFTCVPLFPSVSYWVSVLFQLLVRSFSRFQVSSPVQLRCWPPPFSLPSLFLSSAWVTLVWSVGACCSDTITRSGPQLDTKFAWTWFFWGSAFGGLSGRRSVATVSLHIHQGPVLVCMTLSSNLHFTALIIQGIHLHRRLLKYCANH